MESVISSGTEPTLLTSLDYKLGDVASYIVQRESIVTAPMTGGSFNSVNPFIRFQVADPSALAFADNSTFRLSFVLVNNDAASQLKLAGLPDLAIRRLRLHVRGTLVEDIVMYGRTCTVLHTLRPHRKRKDDYIEAPYTDINSGLEARIPANGRMRYCLDLKLGYVSTGYYHYFGFGALTFEFELEAADNFVCGGANTSNNWSIEQALLLNDVVRVAPDFADGFSKTLLSGGRLLQQMASMQTMMFEIPAGNGDFSVTISRAFIRLKACYITFMGLPDRAKLLPAPADDAAAANVCKEGNTLFCPIKANPARDGNDTWPLEIYGQLGTQTYPVLPMRGSRQMFYHLRRSLGMCKGGEMGIESWDTYTNSQFIAVLSFEKAQSGGGGESASFSGASTLSGEVLRVVLRNLPATAAAGRPSSIYVHLLHDEIVEARGDGITVYV